MKKMVNVISLVSAISLVIMLIIYLTTRNSDLYIKFIVDWFLIPLGFLAIPLLGQAFSLACNRDRIPPPIWLSIYVVIFVLLIFTVGFGYIDQTRDLPIAFRKDSVSVEGEVKNLDSTNSSQIFHIANKEFILSKENFNLVSRNNTYIIFYLPNSNYIIDIIAEDGSSLLKNNNR